ncbi:hypothetical protein JQM97_10460 [Prevotella hominis]|nr:hypothetical protein [Segatella hominis]
MYKIFILKDLQTIYPSNSFNLFREVAFSIRAGCFLFSSRLYSLSNIPNPSRKDSRTSKVHNLSTSRAHNLSTSKSPQPSHKQSPQPSYKQSPQPSYKQSPQPSYKQSPQPFYKQKPTATPHPYCSKKHSENKQIQQNIPNILPFNIFLKSVLKKNRLSRLFDLEISIFYCNFATNLLTH